MDDIKKPTSFVKSGKKISWIAPEFTYYEKGRKWYLTVGILALIIAAAFVWIKSYSGAAVVVAAALVFLTQGGEKPKDAECAIDDDGVHFKGKDFKFEQFKSFWVIGGELPKLYLQKTGKLSMPISIYLKGINPQSIIDFLKQYLPYEEGKGELVHENINRLFRF